MNIKDKFQQGDFIKMKIMKSQLIKIIFATAAILLFLYETSILLANSIVFLEYPAEVRDMAVVELADELSEGSNPYGTEWFGGSKVPVYLDSGFIHVLPAVLLRRLLGFPVKPVLTILNFIYYGISVLMVYKCCRVCYADRSISALLAALQFFFMNRSGVVCLRPDSCAGCVMLLIIYIILKYRFIHPAIDQRQLFRPLDSLLVILLVLLIHLKIHYAVIGVACMISAARNKSAMRIGFKFLFWFMAATLWMQLEFPTYMPVWGERIYEMLHGLQGGETNKFALFKSSFDKYNMLWNTWKPLWISFFIAIVFLVGQRKVGGKKSDAAGEFIFLNIIVNYAALWILGAHEGALLWYHYYMLMPSVLIAVAMGVKAVNGDEKFSANVMSIKRIMLWLSDLALLFVPIWIFWKDVNLSKSMLERDYYERILNSYSEADALMERYKSENMLLSPQLSYFAYNNGIYNIDYGDMAYVPQDNISGSWHLFLPYLHEYRENYITGVQISLEGISNKEYSLITTGLDGYAALGLQEEFSSALKENYRKIDTVTIHTAVHSINTDFWIPNDYDEK